MNILIPHTWLLDHLDTDATPQEIQKYLSLAGPSVERIYDKAGESVYDIEVTTNRVDAMSVRGIAREAAVILRQFGKKGVLKPLEQKSITAPTKPLPLPKIINDPNLSKRVICVVLSHIKRHPTPDWMAERLTQVDMNIHDAAIDITNYITHDLGHPCHAFDYDKLMKTGGEINIVEAQKGETFTTLDGTSFTTVGGEVVFKNGKGEIIDLPSIKGTANTSVDDSTTNILLLMESIQAEKVRYASMTHNIRTVAAQLMEKGVDPCLADSVLIGASELYEQLCEATIGSQVFDEFPAPPHPKIITITPNVIPRYLGFTLPMDTIATILTSLGCQVNITEEPALEVTPPTFRPDLVIPVDIVEEIARIYGYHHIPATLMPTALPVNQSATATFDLEKQLKHALVLTGWQEVYTYSMVSEELALQSGIDLQDHVKIQNPLTEDRVYLRRSLVPSLLEALNQNPDHPNLSVFEIAHTYTPNKNKLPTETLVLTLAARLPVREMRGNIDMLLAQLYQTNVATHHQINLPDGTVNTSLAVAEENQKLVELGYLSVLPDSTVVAQIEIAKLLAVAKTHPTYHPLPRTAIITEDLTFSLPEDQPAGNVLETVRKVSPQVSAVTLKDVYQRNITYTIHYHDETENLSTEGIAPLRKKVITAVEKTHQAKLIGTV